MKTISKSFGSAGAMPREVVYLDIETQKVSCAPITMANGETLRRRWDPIMIGMARSVNGALIAEVAYGWRDWAREFVLPAGTREVRYSATREFDEMILKGRFTNARRAHLAERPAGWPALRGADEVVWTNIKARSGLPRSPDIESRDIAFCDWTNRDRILEEAVVVHCLRDVLDLPLAERGLPAKTFRRVAAFLL